MRLAFSNIAWDRADDERVAELLRAADIDAVELAPTKVWPDPRSADLADARAERERWRGWGLDVVATQSLLFGRPDLQLFHSPGSRAQMLEHLAHVVSLGGAMGAAAQVFGSPKNRRREGLTREAAFGLAVEWFAEVGSAAEQYATAVCLEANPEQYGADFITSAHEAAALVQAVDSPGFRLHLDTACMLLAGDDPTECVLRYAAWLQHLHLSEPDLGPVGLEDQAGHVAVLKALQQVGYVGAVSIEMRPTQTPVESVDAAARYAARLLQSVL